MKDKFFGSRERRRKLQQCRPSLETLGSRVLPSFTTTFSNGVLSIVGSASPNVGAVTPGLDGSILLNGAPIAGGPTLANTSSILFNGGPGNDVLALALPWYTGGTAVNGGDGNDVISAWAGGSVTIDGGAGADSCSGVGMIFNCP